MKLKKDGKDIGSVKLLDLGLSMIAPVVILTITDMGIRLDIIEASEDGEEEIDIRDL